MQKIFLWHHRVLPPSYDRIQSMDAWVKEKNQSRKETIQEPKDALQYIAFEIRCACLLGFDLLGRDSIFATMMHVC